MATIKYKDPATGEIRKIPFVVGNSTPESFYGVLPLEKGGTGATSADEARANIAATKRWKRLWTGSWSDGNIAVPNVWDYFELLIFINGASLWEPMYCTRMNTRLFHGGGCAEYVWTAQTGLFQRHFALALTGNDGDNNTISYSYMVSGILGGTGNGTTSDAKWPITAIYGATLSADVEV